MLSILNAPTHLGWVVWAWKCVFGTSHGTSACVEDLERVSKYALSTAIG